MEKCENTHELDARRIRGMKSNLFSKRECELPPLQNKRSVPHFPHPIFISSKAHPTPSNRMIHNMNNSPFFRLPPELRLRIYKFACGGHNIHIGYTFEDYKSLRTRIITGQIFHDHRPNEPQGSHHAYKLTRFHHLYILERLNLTLDLRFLLTCRAIYSEAELLPYRENTFFFENDAVRRRFENRVRVGKKWEQKRAVGRYGYMPRSTFVVAERQEWQRRVREDVTREYMREEAREQADYGAAMKGDPEAFGASPKVKLERACK